MSLLENAAVFFVKNCMHPLQADMQMCPWDTHRHAVYLIYPLFYSQQITAGSFSLITY